jgi:hypothetical protein
MGDLIDFAAARDKLRKKKGKFERYDVTIMVKMRSPINAVSYEDAQKEVDILVKKLQSAGKGLVVTYHNVQKIEEELPKDAG